MMPALVREGRLTGFAMRYLGRLVAYLAVFFITFSLGYTLLLRWVPVTLTPLKAIRLAEHLPEEGLRVRSNWVPLRKVAMPMVRAVIATVLLDPEARGQGLGARLLCLGMEQYGVSELTVNEQNPAAAGFYRHMGFAVYRRSELDEQGGPYPILYMRRG